MLGPHERRTMYCYACEAVLKPDSACPDTEYQFDNALWIGFHGGYGMFVDNLEALLPTNTDEQWIRNKSDGYKLRLHLWKLRIPFPEKWYRWRLRHHVKMIDNPSFKPKYREERMLTGSDYEAVICHECAHALCEQVGWIGKLLQPANSHAHRTEWKEAHPNHYGWDYDQKEEQ